MGAVTIRNIDDAIKRNARLAAAANGRSLEAELRCLLRRTYDRPPVFDPHHDPERAAKIRAMSGREFVDHLIKVANGATLELPERTAESIDFPEL